MRLGVSNVPMRRGWARRLTRRSWHVRGAHRRASGRREAGDDRGLEHREAGRAGLAAGGGHPDRPGGGPGRDGGARAALQGLFEASGDSAGGRCAGDPQRPGGATTVFAILKQIEQAGYDPLAMRETWQQLIEETEEIDERSEDGLHTNVGTTREPERRVGDVHPATCLVDRGPARRGERRARS